MTNLNVSVSGSNKFFHAQTCKWVFLEVKLHKLPWMLSLHFILTFRSWSLCKRVEYASWQIHNRAPIFFPDYYAHIKKKSGKNVSFQNSLLVFFEPWHCYCCPMAILTGAQIRNWAICGTKKCQLKAKSKKTLSPLLMNLAEQLHSSTLVTMWQNRSDTFYKMIH